ncbi:MAG: hypothetical protein ABFE01_26760, partial [Phycisphaerales bacterium]
MRTKWTAAVAAGAILVVLSSQAMAQPGNGRGRGFGRGQGMGRWAQGPTEVGQRAEPNGSGTPCPFGYAPRGRGGWNGPGLGNPGFGARFGQRLGLTDEQMQKIHAIVRDARSRTLAAIKAVLTDEQAKQLEQMCPRAGQPDRFGRGRAMRSDFAGPRGRRFEQGPGFGPRMGCGARWGGRPDAAMDRPAGPEGNRMMPRDGQRSVERDADQDRGPERG